MYEDKRLICKDCGKTFTFSAKDQQFYAERGFRSPVRCKSCRDMRKYGTKPRSATLEELLRYRKMPCAYENAIRRLAESIVADYASSSAAGMGWILSRTHNKYSHPRDPKVTEYIYVLRTTGEFQVLFSEYADQNEEYAPWRSGSDADIDVQCEEFDFSAKYQGIYNRGDVVRFVDGHDTYTLTRYYDVKGQGLFNKLKEISEKKIEPVIIDRPRPEEYRAVLEQIETAKRQKENQQKSTKGCYVATCVYGSYDCSQVQVLRRFRDNVLAKTWYGRAFIKIYYAISPSLVQLFGTSAWFKALWNHRAGQDGGHIENERYF